MKKKGFVFVMMSGGVDSSVAAAVLKEQGYDVVGVFMKCWSIQQLQSLGVSDDLYGCFWEQDSKDAQSVCGKLDIPYYVWDFQDEYKQKVVDYMVSEYKQGRTPNPDVMCNSVIKFGIFYKKAMALGADFVATGHYARILNSEKLKTQFPFSEGVAEQGEDGVVCGGQKVIARGKDNNKDQTYFIWQIRKEQIEKILFPVGEFETKAELRKMAEDLDLITADKKDSQGLCFIGETPLRDLLMEFIGQKEGDIIDENGEVLGKHPGAYLYTIGQRNQLGLAGGPWFVKSIDVEKNQVIVTHKNEEEKLYSDELIATELNWQVSIEDDNFECEAQIRYRQQAVKCKVTVIASEAWQSRNGNKAKVKFEKPVRAVAKGQSIVFYDGEVMLGGGVIC